MKTLNISDGQQNPKILPKDEFLRLDEAEKLVYWWKQNASEWMMMDIKQKTQIAAEANMWSDYHQSIYGC